MCNTSPSFVLYIIFRFSMLLRCSRTYVRGIDHMVQASVHDVNFLDALVTKELCHVFKEEVL